MPYAYKWLSNHQKDEIQDFEVYVSEETIWAIFKNSSTRFDSFRYIEYMKKGDSTFVSYLGKDKEVKENVIDAFCDDFECFLMYHNTVSNYLIIRGQPLETNTNNRIFECMKSALESRKEKLHVKSIRFNIFDQKQVMELLQFINPEILTKVDFSLSNFEELTDYLVEWNRSDRLEVIFRCKDLSTEILTSFKRMFNYPSVFSRIQLGYEKSDDFKKEKLISLFEPFELSKYESYYIQIELEDPSVVANLAEQAARLNLQDVRSLEVFANPLLMKIIVEQIDYFDILSLRKVSRDIRSCIDTLKPDPRIASYQIYILEGGPRETPVYYYLNDIRLKNGNKKRLTSRTGTYQCNIDKRVVCVEAINLFKRNILHQKSKIYDFFLEPAGNLIELIGDVLKLRETPLRVERLIMKRFNESDIMKILPYLDSVESILNFFCGGTRTNESESSRGFKTCSMEKRSRAGDE